jgi:hypothetical protein
MTPEPPIDATEAGTDRTDDDGAEHRPTSGERGEALDDQRALLALIASSGC